MGPILLQQAAHEAETGKAARPRPESREFPSTSVYRADLGTKIVNLSYFLTRLVKIRTSFQLCGSQNQDITICPLLIYIGLTDHNNRSINPALVFNQFLDRQRTSVCSTLGVNKKDTTSCHTCGHSSTCRIITPKTSPACHYSNMQIQVNTAGVRTKSKDICSHCSGR